MTQSKVKWSQGLRKFIDLNPTLVRGTLVSIAAISASILNKEVIQDDLIEALVGGFIAISALISALWSRPAVIAEKKVIAWKLDPDANTNGNIVPGPAVATTELEFEEVAVAANESLGQKEVREA